MQLKTHKACGSDAMFPEFFIHMNKNARRWFTRFYTDCYNREKIPNEWKMSIVRAILKPGKDKNAAESYGPISLLSVLYKLFERIIYNRIGNIIDEHIPIEQAGF